MEVTARYRDGVAFEIEARSHRTICDQPKDNAGRDAGMSPPEFLLAALAACAGYYAIEYLKTRGLPAEGVAARVIAGKKLKPARLGTMRIEVDVPALDSRHEEGVLRAVKACLIHNTLLNAPEIETVIMAPVSPAA